MVQEIVRRRKWRKEFIRTGHELELQICTHSGEGKCKDEEVKIIEMFLQEKVSLSNVSNNRATGAGICLIQIFYKMYHMI